MSLLNGIASLGSGLTSFAAGAAKDEEDNARTASLLNGASTPDASAASSPDSPPAKAGPRMPDGVNPYAGDPHAAALWLAERAIIGPESGGRADAQNPISSAGGLFQITNPTWDAAIGKMGLLAPASDAERSAQKYDPAMNTAVMRRISSDAAAALDAAGLPVTPETLQAAHRLGPAGAAAAIRAASANPDAPLIGNGLAPDAARGNGDISHLTVGQFLTAPYPRADKGGG